MNIIPYGRQDISAEDVSAVVAALTSDFLTQGPTIRQFEEKFSSYIGAHHSMAVANGTAALHLCALALGVNSDTNVITSPITFAASANCVRYCGGSVWFADIDPETLCLDTRKVEQLLQSKPKGFFSGIIPVDFAGYPADMVRFRELADEYGLWIIEDSCHAPGAGFVHSGNVHRCGDGSLADLAIFSFHPVKHIATGEGGMITTNNPELAQKIELLRTHGITKDAGRFSNSIDDVEQGGWYYEMQELGYNYRITDIQCALGISQLSRAHANLQRRKHIAQVYNQAFESLPVGIRWNRNIPDHAFHLYVITTDRRKELYDFLRTRGIYAQVHYVPVHLHPYYRQLGWNKGDFPNAEEYYSQCLSLPMYPSMTDSDIGQVIAAVKEFYS